MQYVTPSFTFAFALLFTACGSSAPAEISNTTVPSNVISANIATVRCTWVSGAGGFVAPVDAMPPSTWSQTVQVAGPEDGEVFPATFKPFTAKYVEKNAQGQSTDAGNGVVWISFVSTDLNDTESCPDFIDDGGMHFTFQVIADLLFVTATYTDSQGKSQLIQWGS